MQLYADDDVDVEPVVLNSSVVLNGSQWFSCNGSQWFSCNGSQWFSMVPSGSNGSQRFSMLSSDFIVVPSGSQWQAVIPVVLNGF